LTIRYAFDHAQHVYGHIFTNSNSALAGPEQIQEWLDSAPKSAANIRSKGLAAIDRIAVHPRRARNLPEAVKAPLLADCAMLKPEGVANTLEYTNPFTSVREIAAANPRPLLLCCGVKEKRFADNRQWAEANLTNLSVVEIDAGHGVNMEGAEAFNVHVCAFVKSHADP
jgi:pimeloyl-ACP methyl ester carboxylesterase